MSDMSMQLDGAQGRGQCDEALDKFHDEIQEHVSDIVTKIVNTLARPYLAEKSYEETPRFAVTQRLLNRIDIDLTKALMNNGFHRCIGDAGYCLPYQETLPPDFDCNMTLFDLCNHSDIGRKRVPYSMVRHILHPSNTDFMLPQQKFIPLNCQKIASLYLSKPHAEVQGDLARGVPMGYLWNCLCPAMQQNDPHWDFDSNANPEFVEFDLVQAILTGRRSGTFLRPVPLCETLFYDCAENNLCNPGEERYNTCGIMFKIARQIAEAWNAMICSLHNCPRMSSREHKQIEKYLYDLHDVQQVLAAVSAIVHANTEQACFDSNMFWGARCNAPHNSSSKFEDHPQFHVTQLRTAEQIAHARHQHAEFSTKFRRGPRPQDGKEVDLEAVGVHNLPPVCSAHLPPPCNSNAQVANCEKLSIRSNASFATNFWADAKDVLLTKPKFINENSWRNPSKPSHKYKKRF